MISNTVETA